MHTKSLAAVSALAGLLGAALPAQAIVVSSGPVSIAVPDDIDGVYLNMVTGAFGAVPPVGYDINPYSAFAGQFNLWGATTTTWLATSGVVAGPYPIAPGTSISAAGLFFRPGGGTNVGTQVTLNATNLFGVQFLNEGPAITNYGWVAMTFGASAGVRTITGWAYETTGAEILAGAVPEPGSYAMLLAGLAVVGGVAARSRKANATA